jgi:nucleotide-binding universal stress UspA family protein
MERIKILIPTDFSVQAEYAYWLIKNLGNKIDMDIHFLHVLPVPDTVTMDASGTISTCGEIDVHYVEKQVEMARKKLEQMRSQYGEDIKTHLLLGKITDGIIEFSEKNNIDLIAMGTKGAFGLKEKISGSETQMIARRSSIPVLSLMCDRSDLVVRNILLVHDFRRPADENLELLKKFMAAFDAKVHFLQITDGDPEKEKADSEANMKLFASLNGIESFESHLLKDGDVESGVIHFNQMQEMDMVCIGTHGQGGWLHQSATEKLINHLYKPIISFRLIH